MKSKKNKKRENLSGKCDFFMEVLKNFLKKYWGYIILIIIFIVILTVMYFTLKSKKEIVYVTQQDTTQTRQIDSLRLANMLIQERIINLQSQKENIKYIIIKNQNEYENEISDIENNSADSNYIQLKRILSNEP